MLVYAFKRILLFIPIFLGATLIMFTITRLVPGGPLEGYMRKATFSKTSQNENTKVTKAEMSLLKEYYGLNLTFTNGYMTYLKKTLLLDWGYSFRYSVPVSEIIKEKIPPSLFFGLFYLFFTYIFSIILGFLKAYFVESFFDRLSSLVLFFFYAIPAHLMGLILLFIFSIYLDWFPLGNLTSASFQEMGPLQKIKDILWHGTLPLLAYLLPGLSFMTLFVKNNVRGEMSKNYVKFAYAKGLKTRDVFFKHILKNILIPLTTYLGNNITLIISGSFLIETIFNIDGMGLLGFESIMDRDYPVVMGIMLVTIFVSVMGRLISDLLVLLIDPRVNFSKFNLKGQL